MSHPKKPCPGCPYARQTARGELRGQDPRRFVAQALGPFLLPCHRSEERPGGEGWREISTDRPQCAGAAMFRGALEEQRLRDHRRMPAALTHLEPDYELVFRDPAEMVSHHEGRRVTVSFHDLAAWLHAELHHPGARPVDQDDR